MAEDDGNPGSIQTVAGCAKIAGRIELALFGEDGRHGMVKDISDINHDISDIKNNMRTAQKKDDDRGRDWRGVLRTIVAGGTIAVLTWAISHGFP